MSEMGFPKACSVNPQPARIPRNRVQRGGTPPPLLATPLHHTPSTPLLPSMQTLAHTSQRTARNEARAQQLGGLSWCRGMCVCVSVCGEGEGERCGGGVNGFQPFIHLSAPLNP